MVALTTKMNGPEVRGTIPVTPKALSGLHPRLYHTRHSQFSSLTRRWIWPAPNPFAPSATPLPRKFRAISGCTSRPRVLDKFRNIRNEAKRPRLPSVAGHAAKDGEALGRLLRRIRLVGLSFPGQKCRKRTKRHLTTRIGRCSWLPISDAVFAYGGLQPSEFVCRG
jgi:hypothetical protein